MTKLSPEQIDNIRQSVDIVDIVADYLPLQKKGRNYIAVCPFHEDTRPSMSVSQDKQIYKCFVCGAGGNAFTFLQNYLDISFIEAVAKTASKANIDIGQVSFEKPKPQIANHLLQHYRMHEDANEIYRHYLNTRQGIHAKEYLNTRHLDDHIIQKFNIGYAPTNNPLLNAFEQQGFKTMDMIASGLIIESNTLFDRFNDRLIFPIHNHDGAVVGFSGRKLKNDDSAKYINSPVSQIFIKGEILYNYYRLNKSKKLDSIYICEGFMDVIALSRVGVDNAVATMGTALSQQHLKALKKLTLNIKLCFDGDRAGQQATIKHLEVLEQNGFHVMIVKLKEGMDPDEILNQYGENELLTILNQPIHPIDFKLKYYYASNNMKNYEDKKQFLQMMVPLIAQIEDQIDQTYYIEEICKLTDFTKDIVHLALSQTVSKVVVKETNFRMPKIIQSIDKYKKAEASLLYYMMQERAVAQKFEKEVGFMFDETYQIIAYYIIEVYKHQFVLEIADLINKIKDPNIIHQLTTICEMNLPPLSKKIDEQIVRDDSIIDDYIRIIKEKPKKEEIEQLSKAILDVQDPLEQAKLLQQRIALKEKRDS